MDKLGNKFPFLSPPANHNPPAGGEGGNVGSSEAKPPALFLVGPVGAPPWLDQSQRCYIPSTEGIRLGLATPPRASKPTDSTRSNRQIGCFGSKSCSSPSTILSSIYLAQVLLLKFPGIEVYDRRSVNSFVRSLTDCANHLGKIGCKVC